jgi:hypothetical protein
MDSSQIDGDRDLPGQGVSHRGGGNHLLMECLDGIIIGVGLDMDCGCD